MKKRAYGRNCLYKSKNRGRGVDFGKQVWYDVDRAKRETSLLTEAGQDKWR